MFEQLHILESLAAAVNGHKVRSAHDGKSTSCKIDSGAHRLAQQGRMRPHLLTACKLWSAGQQLSEARHVLPQQHCDQPWYVGWSTGVVVMQRRTAID